MKPTLKPGLSYRLVFTVPENKTVPHLYPESPEMQAMPEVFATGFMVGLFEWACTRLLRQHLDDDEESLGVHVDFSHQAATPAGMTVTVDCEVVQVDGMRVRFKVRGHDGIDEIGAGLHDRYVVKRAKFEARVADKKKRASGLAGVA